MIDTVGEVLLVIGATGAGAVAVVAGSIWYGVRRIRRSPAIKRRVERGELNVKALSTDPTIREVAKRRLSLRRSTDASTRSIEAAREAGRPVGDLPQVAKSLEKAFREIDDDLRVIENEPNPALRHRLLTAVLPDIEEHERLSADLRRSLLSSRQTDGNRSLRRAADDLELEADAMRALDDLGPGTDPYLYDGLRRPGIEDRET